MFEARKKTERSSHSSNVLHFLEVPNIYKRNTNQNFIRTYSQRIYFERIVSKKFPNCNNITFNTFI